VPASEKEEKNNANIPNFAVDIDEIAEASEEESEAEVDA